MLKPPPALASSAWLTPAFLCFPTFAPASPAFAFPAIALPAAIAAISQPHSSASAPHRWKAPPCVVTKLIGGGGGEEMSSAALVPPRVTPRVTPGCMRAMLG